MSCESIWRLRRGDDAQRELESRADAILLYLLNAVFVSTVGQRHRWAHSQFVQEAIVEVCSEYDTAFRRKPGWTAGHLFQNIQKIAEMSADERESGKQITDAVVAVQRIDNRADAERLYEALREAAEAFYAYVERKFQEALA